MSGVCYIISQLCFSTYLGYTVVIHKFMFFTLLFKAFVGSEVYYSQQHHDYLVPEKKYTMHALQRCGEGR